MRPNLNSAILHALWKWKILPTAAIAEQFFGNQYSEAAYKRMRSLRSARLVELVLCQHHFQGNLWTLTRAGFQALQGYVDELREVGFRSEAVEHDYLCTAFQRGHWIAKAPAGLTLVSEQQLRRCYPEDLDAWIPKSDLHRADGFTILHQGEETSVTAIEVELNKKGASDYAKISSYYSADRVTRVLWLAKDKGLAKSVQALLAGFHPERKRLHQFVLLSDFLEHFWNAPVVLGTEAGLPIQELFAQPASPMLLCGAKPAMLDLRLRTYSSQVYAFGSDRALLNRVASLAPIPSSSERAPHTASSLSNVPALPSTSQPKTPRGVSMFKMIPVTLLTFCLVSCASKPKINTPNSDSKNANVPSLTSPEVRRMWVPEKIEGNKFIEGHYMYVIDKPSVWSR